MEKDLTIKQALDLAAEMHNEGKLHEAEIIYKKVLEKNPMQPDALHLLGLIEYQNNRHEEAVKLIQKAIQIKEEAIYYGNLGMVYDALKEDEKAAQAFRKALELNPEYGNAYLAHYNLGVFLNDKGEIEEALKHYESSIKLNPEFAEAHWNRGLLLLLLEKFEEGWREYKYRFKKQSPSDARIFNKPEWDGSDLGGKKILVVSEQGAGDSIQFIRYIPLVKKMGGQVILECGAELEKLFNGFNGIDEVVIREKNTIPNIPFDFYIHLMDLPSIFNTNLRNIPSDVPYIKADREKTGKMKRLIETKGGKNKNTFKVGIVWAGNPNQENDKNRSTSFEKFSILKDIPNVTLFSLQKGDAEKQITKNNFGVINLSEHINDFSDTAAIIENLDLIISVDTSVAHLAGAMGKQVWTILTFIPDWRWHLKKERNAWYPTMKLFRQEKQGDWDSLFKEVRMELEKMIGQN